MKSRKFIDEMDEIVGFLYLRLSTDNDGNHMVDPGRVSKLRCNPIKGIWFGLELLSHPRGSMHVVHGTYGH